MQGAPHYAALPQVQKFVNGVYPSETKPASKLSHCAQKSVSVMLCHVEGSDSKLPPDAKKKGEAAFAEEEQISE